VNASFTRSVGALDTALVFESMKNSCRRDRENARRPIGP
jgi:hypothetical protein